MGRTVSAWAYARDDGPPPVIRARVWSEEEEDIFDDEPRRWAWHVELVRGSVPWQYVGVYMRWTTAMEQACSAVEHATRGAT